MTLLSLPAVSNLRDNHSRLRTGEVRRIKDRILNPASHAGAAPLYKKEAEDAVKVIGKLNAALDAALATL